MKGNFDKALARVLVYEGGYSNNPKDPGGATMKGITQSTYNAWLASQRRDSGPVKEIKTSDVQAIYKQEFWDRIKGDQLPPGVDFCMFDAAVNSGVGGATTWAQTILGLVPDGSLGSKTLEAILSDDPEDFIQAYCARRLGTLKRLRTWSTFGKGWEARIANVQKTSLAWAGQEDGPDPIMADTVGGNAKARMSDVPTSSVTAITTHATTLGGAVATGATQAASSLSGLDFTWAKYLLGGLTAVSALAGLLVLVSKSWNDAAANGVATAKVDPDADAEVATAKTVTDTEKVATGAQVPVNNAGAKPNG